MVTVVLDADFLSSFLKIESLHRVREYFRADKLSLPTAVFQEVAVTTLADQLTSQDWLEIRPVEPDALAAASNPAAQEFAELGAGEQQAIALAHQEDAVLLMNDKKALRYARRLEVATVNVPTFLLLYRASGQREASEVRRLVEALENKDHYSFTEEVRRKLLAD